MNTGYSAEVVLDSIAPSGIRLTTMAIRYPRFVHSEFMTHRQYSRNASSSRAIPVRKRIEMVETDPVIPVEWGANQPGMQAHEMLDATDESVAQAAWLNARDEAVHYAKALDIIGVHKQLVNRLLEPWTWIDVLVSSTEWSNFFALRCDKNAQPELRTAAYQMREAFLPNLAQYSEYWEEPSPEFIKTCHLMQQAWESSVPRNLELDQWHLPYITDDDRVQFPDDSLLARLAVARCARISYLNHEGKREPAKDFGLATGLEENGHWSPFEHVAQAIRESWWSGNFRGWVQYRKMFPNECL